MFTSIMNFIGNWFLYIYHLIVPNIANEYKKILNERTVNLYKTPFLVTVPQGRIIQQVKNELYAKYGKSRVDSAVP